MLSYRHAFHAGNHADVLKHSIQIHCIQHLLNKDKSILYIDTHAGAGLYDLKGNYADSKKEYLTGISKLMNKKDLPHILSEYVELISSFNPTFELEFYPGSPSIAQRLLRTKDQLRLHELHNNDFSILKDRTANDPRVTLQKKDGLRGMIKGFPPASRRGFALIDPPYEIKTDYEILPFAIDDALFKFPQAMITIWYPMLESEAFLHLKENLIQLSGEKWLWAELTVRKKSKGLYGSGIWVINPPWNLPQALNSIQTLLPDLLQEDEGAALNFEYSIP